MRFYITISAFFISFFLLASEKQVVLNDSLNQLNLDTYTYLYSTKDDDVDIQTVIDKKFEYTPKGLNIGLTDKIYWVKFNFNNPTNQTQKFYIYFPYSHINKINAYIRYKDNIQHLNPTGIYYSSSQNNIKTIGHCLCVELESGKSSVFINVNHIYLPLRGLSFLLSEKKMISVNADSEHAIWFWKGFFLLAMIITIILFLATKLRMFLYYFILNIGVGMFFSSEIGDIHYYFLSDPFNITIDIKHFGNILVLIFFPLLINEITPISKAKPRIWKVMFFVIYPVVAFWAVCLIPFMKDTYMLFFTTLYLILLTVFVFLVQLYLIFESFRKKQKNSFVLFIGYSIYISIILLNILLPNLGLIENKLRIYYASLYGSILEIILFMFLIGKETLSVYKQRSDLLKKEKKHQEEMLKIIIESQERERNRIGTELHDMIGGNISVIKQQLDKKNVALISIVDKTIESVRSMSHGLITPLIKKWMPHIRVISPRYIQKKLCEDAEKFLANQKRIIDD